MAARESVQPAIGAGIWPATVGCDRWRAQSHAVERIEAPGSRHGQSHLPLSHGPAGMNERSDSAGVDLSADAGASIEKRLLRSFGLRAVATEGCDRRLWRYRVEPVNRDHT